jgi:limonene-1,2-epoxide hydrolase
MNGDAATRYQRYWEELTPATVERLRDLATPDMRFADPFNDVVGVDKVIAVLRAGFADAEGLAFDFRDRAQSVGGTWYYRWQCRFRPRRFKGPPWVIEGMSEVRFDAAGRVVEHVDHWDAGGQFYARIPVLGWLIGLVRKRLRVD